jgi:hypothetical protein
MPKTYQDEPYTTEIFRVVLVYESGNIVVRGPYVNRKGASSALGQFRNMDRQARSRDEWYRAGNIELRGRPKYDPLKGGEVQVSKLEWGAV